MEETFNAEQARRISDQNSPEGLLKILLAEIKQEAARGGYSYVTRKYGFGESALYDIESNYPTQILEVLKSLRLLGFDAKVMTEERQFVDIYLQVKW